MFADKIALTELLVVTQSIAQSYSMDKAAITVTIIISPPQSNLGKVRCCPSLTISLYNQR